MSCPPGRLVRVRLSSVQARKADLFSMAAKKRTVIGGVDTHTRPFLARAYCQSSLENLCQACPET
jgi:hypothetical protein